MTNAPHGLATTRGLTLGLAVTAIALAAGCTAQTTPGTKTQSPAATTVGIGWQGAQIELPAGSGMACPTGRQQLASAATPSGKAAWVKGEGTTNNFIADFPAVVTGDLTGDGNIETVLKVRCTSLEPSQEQDADLPGQLLIVRVVDDKHLTGLAYVGPTYARYPQIQIINGQLRTQVWYETESSNSVYAPAHTRTYAWNGTGFNQTSGRTSPLILVPAKAGNGSPVTLPAVRDGNTLSCAASKLVFNGGEAHSAQATYSVTGNAQLIDLDNDGNQELLAEIVCTIAGVSRTSLYLLRQEADGLTAIDVPVANAGTLQIDNGWKLTGADLTITISNIQSGEKKKHIMRWDGSTFQGKIGTVG